MHHVQDLAAAESGLCGPIQANHNNPNYRNAKSVSIFNFVFGVMIWCEQVVLCGIVGK